MFLFTFSPFQAQAGFFSIILGDNAYADTTTAMEVKSELTSATMDLPRARVSPILTNKGQADTSVSINIISDKALLSTAGPMGVLDGTGGGDFSFDETSFYVVRSGDTVSAVAEMFGVTPDTIYSANNMEKGDKLKEGDVLLILPFSGVEYTVVKDDTLQGIANRHKVNLDDLLIHNDIDLDAKLSIGEKLIIPGANMPNKVVKSGSSSVATGGSSSSSMPSVIGYFKNPLPNGKRTRGITSSHKGVDLAAPTGTYIYAAASGTVLIARNGYNGGFGNYVVIQHPNGVKTLYAHMSRLGTTSGANVSQGEMIGYVGNTGNSRGSHLHFEVLGAKNPF